MEQIPEPTTLLEAVRAFADPQVAHDYFVRLRFPNAIACPRHGCGSADIAAIKNRRTWRCRDCGRQFSVKVGTVFEDSPIGFDKWLPAMWLLSANRNGISSCELARGLGITQKTAWFMLHRLRHVTQTPTFEKMQGEIEVDETDIGGKPRWNRPRLAVTRYNKEAKAIKKTPRRDKTAIMGFRERGKGGNVRAFVIPDGTQSTLAWRLREHVKRGSTVYTGAHPGYISARHIYRHFVINHSLEYVRGHIHTNSIESFWSLLKRTIKGTYICPRAKHMNAYIAEQVFRFNERENKDGPRFVLAVKGTDSKRLTWKALVERRSY